MTRKIHKTNCIACDRPIETHRSPGSGRVERTDCGNSYCAELAEKLETTGWDDDTLDAVQALRTVTAFRGLASAMASESLTR